MTSRPDPRITDLERRMALRARLSEEYRRAWNEAEDRVLNLERQLAQARADLEAIRDLEPTNAKT